MIFKKLLGVDLEDFRELPRDRAASLLRERIPDLLSFLRSDQIPPAARGLAERLHEDLGYDEAELLHLRDRLVVESFMRSEYDRDQNVYLGRFYTRFLTQAVPDVVFQPLNAAELGSALAWARKAKVGVALRGAGSTAMGGSVPNRGGLLLDMSRFDQIQIDAADRVAVLGAGARFKSIHKALAAEGLALKSYPSNLGGTLAGWFSAGGLGLNSFKYGTVQEQVRAMSVILSRGEHVRFHDDGRLDVLGSGDEAQRLTPEQAEEWMREHGYPVLGLMDLAQTEGQFGILVTFTVDVIPLTEQKPFYFEFDNQADALHFASWVGETASARRCPPTNLKFLSASHVEAVQTIRGDLERRVKPAVYIDFDDAVEAQRFESGLDVGKWRVHRDDAEASRWYADRFRPQQTKRLGPGFIAAEILMPSKHVERYLDRAERLAHRVGIHLETEAYFFGDGRALVLPGYLTRGKGRGFVWELLFAPMLLDIALSRYDGTPYVLGRWQSPYFRKKYASGSARQLKRAKKLADAKRLLNPGIFFGPRFKSPILSGLFQATFPGMVRLMRGFYAAPGFSGMIRAFIGKPPSVEQHRERARAARELDADAVAVTEDLAEQARGCVNCGECNSVCPIFDDAKIRLPQMLTHIGEKMNASTSLQGTEQLLLDLCMRCGNCEQVCQADIPHLDLYARMEQQAGDYKGERRERHAAVLAHLRHSERYLRKFLDVRPGVYLNRTPASLPGEVRFLLFRAENDEGAEATCIHCGACVPVCPTNANFEYEDSSDLRRITTDLERCVGCGTCVEVCPANAANGSQTLRVMEAPTKEYFAAVAEFEGKA